MATEKINISLYNWEVNIVFYPKSHQYKKDWKNILSVSGICNVIDKPYLITWATNLAKNHLLEKIKEDNITEQDIITACLLHDTKKKEAGNIGSQSHEWVEKYIKENTLSLPSNENVLNCINWFLKWEKQHNIEYLHSEIFVYSRLHNYVGICDCIAIIDWKKYLIDFKTSNSIYLLEYWMQTSAYCKAYEEQTWDKIDWIIIVRFPKDEIDKYWNYVEPFEVQEIIDIEWFYKAFLAAKVLKEYVKQYK